MSVHNLRDGSASLSLPDTRTFSYSAPSIGGTVPLDLFFMRVGNMCTMRIDFFKTFDSTTFLRFDMSGIPPAYVPSNAVNASFVYTVGGVVTDGLLTWTQFNNMLTLTFTISPATDARAIDRPQTINYNLN